MPDRPRRLPVSTRHAFALAFDLAVRRDPFHSLLLPLLLRAPWIVAMAVLPQASESDRPGAVLLVTSVAMIGDFFAFLLVTAMLRFRARSVFNTPHDVKPASAWDCYAQGIRRIPWLFVTEAVRNIAIGLGALALLVPGLFLGYRLSFATEAVVLSEPELSSSFRRSFQVTRHHFERWVELIAVSAALILAITFVVAVLMVFVPGPPNTVWVVIMWLLVATITPVIQYGWTFFYLRLVEVDIPAAAADAAASAGSALESPFRATPQLTLVETPPPLPPLPARDED
jgi:hypothetical protein